MHIQMQIQCSSALYRYKKLQKKKGDYCWKPALTNTFNACSKSMVLTILCIFVQNIEQSLVNTQQKPLRVETLSIHYIRSIQRYSVKVSKHLRIKLLSIHPLFKCFHYHSGIFRNIDWINFNIIFVVLSNLLIEADTS